MIPSYTLEYIPRARNVRADELANCAMDSRKDYSLPLPSLQLSDFVNENDGPAPASVSVPTPVSVSDGIDVTKADEIKDDIYHFDNDIPDGNDSNDIVMNIEKIEEVEVNDLKTDVAHSNDILNVNDSNDIIMKVEKIEVNQINIMSIDPPAIDQNINDVRATMTSENSNDINEEKITRVKVNTSDVVAIDQAEMDENVNDVISTGDDTKDMCKEKIIKDKIKEIKKVLDSIDLSEEEKINSITAICTEENSNDMDLKKIKKGKGKKINVDPMELGTDDITDKTVVEDIGMEKKDKVETKRKS